MRRITRVLPLLLAATPAFAAGGGVTSDPLTLVGLYLGGLAFLLVEFFLVPGFGLPGLLGLALLGGNVYLIFQGYGSGMAWGIFMTQFVLGLGATVAAMKILPHTALGKMMTHKTTLASKAPVDPALDPDLVVGKEGVAQGALSPQGEVRLDGQLYPAKVEAGMIQNHESVRVVGVSHNTLIVQRLEKEGTN